MKKFDLGQVVVTQGIVRFMEKENGNTGKLAECLVRHTNCDWGDLCDYDKKMNDDAVKNGDRILSAYEIGEDKTKIWIITEWDRSVTTILLPEEY